MPTREQRARRPMPAMIVSAVCHTAAVALLLAGATRAIRVQPKKPSTRYSLVSLQVAGGARAPRLPLPPSPGADKSAKLPPAQKPVLRAARPPREPQLARASGTSAAAARQSDQGTNSVAGNGSDAENTTPAFPVFSPHPAVRDRSLLPASERQVVVDVQLNAGGEVVSANLVRGIGNDLDRIVLDIVKTWRFQPATVDGKPVASEDEVIVPFSPRYPASDS